MLRPEGHRASPVLQEGGLMTILWIVAAVLVVLWLIGLVAHILGAAIHILLVLAVIALIVGFIQNR